MRGEFAMVTSTFAKMILALALGTSLLTGCGKDDKSETSAVRAGAADLMRAIDCGDGGAALNLAASDLRHVPASDVRVSQDGVDTTLCEYLQKSGGKNVALFQFVGIKCYACLRWVEHVATTLASYATDILSVVIMVDDQTLTSDADMASLKTLIAPDAQWARDTTGAAWKFFAPATGPGGGAVPQTVVMDRAARGFFTDDTTLDASGIVGMANASMSLGIAPTP